LINLLNPIVKVTGSLEIIMRGLFRRLFGGAPATQTPTIADRFFLDVECERCGERFHLHINRATDCLQIFDESGVAWRLQREVVGARCRTSLQVRIDIGPGGQVVHREIMHGRFLMPEETIAAT
jgi:hypothetical protein